MCDIFALSVSHRITNFQVCVDLIVSPFGILITRSIFARYMLVTGVPGSTKWPVLPASSFSVPTVILIFDVLNIVSAWGDYSMLCWLRVCFQILWIDTNGIVVDGIGRASLSIDESYVSIAVSVMLSSK